MLAFRRMIVRAIIGWMLICGAAIAAGADQPLARTPWGAPDLQGVWDFRTLVPLERPPALADKAFLTPAEAQAIRDQSLAVARADGRTENAKLDVEGAYNRIWLDPGSETDENLQTSLIIDPPNGRLPQMKPAAEAAMRKQARERLQAPVREFFSYSADPTAFRPVHPESLGLSERCLVGFNAGPPIMPSAYNNNLRIVQTPTHVMLMTEMIHEARVIPIDGTPHLPHELNFWMGDSRGHWEGDTLVVETTNRSDKKPAFQMPVVVTDPDASAAIGSAANSRLIERFTPMADGKLRYESTIDDPASFVAPFTIRFPMRPASGRIFEYACHEGNYAMGGILRGARLHDTEDELASTNVKQ
jgi:hypothetical protein